ncbi:hypothetical protein DI392_00790 [Vibrio albus]|uniref:Tyr recombinase domain-containing protein n=1 Tax=Vibrio albus TaxID=2200953 RepID=A0A2U3BDJ8_9VIBR|nr:site-specific integrase [Vibrio albus]PWI34850.1 hypothetical protein DI392_00790 [Vibrio albus]
MMATHVVSFSDSAIRRLSANEEVTQLRDPRYSLRFRYGKDRQTGSWYLYKCVKGREVWRKIGNWPQLKTKDVVNKLPDIESRLVTDPEIETVTDELTSVADLLCWYRDRSKTDRNLGRSRRSTIRWAINRHLLPRIGSLSLEDVNHAELDELLFWAMQENYSNATVRSVWNVLKQAMKRAHKLKHIVVNPIAGYQFSDFIDQSISAKTTEIHPHQIPDVLHQIESAAKPGQILSLLMLLHGTRIGETRVAKWEQISFETERWHIPAKNTKTKRAHELPLTQLAINILRSYRQWQKEQGYAGAFLFPNQPKRGPINNNVANEWIRDVSGGEWRSHSLRKAARTAWMDLGIDYMVGEMLLNHTMSKLDQAYIHTFAEKQKSQALAQYHDWFIAENDFLKTHLVRDITEIERMTDKSAA